MPTGIFTNPLSITSQFPFCGLPLRLDSYAGCAFRCSYCFARYRGGNSYGDKVRPADPQRLARMMDKAGEKSRVDQSGLLVQFLRRRVPIHLGGMSDPFQPAETLHRVTESMLKILARHHYPTVISTKGSLVASPRYLSLLKAIGTVVVQFSFSSSEDAIARIVEPASAAPTSLLRAMETLANNGVPVTCRWQPFIPGLSESPSAFVPRLSAVGCRHVALEHLKIPVERQHPLWERLTTSLGRNLRAEYGELGARRDGREFVLPHATKLPTVLQVASAVRKHGMTFGAADNEFQYLSDTACCCSGVDQFAGFENWFKHQIAYAVRKCIGKRITYDSIAREWAPAGSIDWFLNSRSRLSRQTGRKGSVRDHIQARWNDPARSGSPASFYGVRSNSTTTANGLLIYQWDRELVPSSI
ncbi:MAG: radical SAM protein [Pyrinomonadaceae bacterium]|nr:radical SAM protein [Pyrinomonadaceae bacterium]